jgi:hypothetical protein
LRLPQTLGSSGRTRDVGSRRYPDLPTVLLAGWPVTLPGFAAAQSTLTPSRLLAAPGIPPTDALRMAARYVAADEAKASTEHLDAYLALGAWDDETGKEAIDRGWLPLDWWVVKEARND